jgi:hypothetical protein
MQTFYLHLAHPSVRDDASEPVLVVASRSAAPAKASAPRVQQQRAGRALEACGRFNPRPRRRRRPPARVGPLLGKLLDDVPRTAQTEARGGMKRGSPVLQGPAPGVMRRRAGGRVARSCVGVLETTLRVGADVDVDALSRRTTRSRTSGEDVNDPFEPPQPPRRH